MRHKRSINAPATSFFGGVTAAFIIATNMMSVSTYAQDPEFTQFYANPMYLNPAFAGTARCPRLVANYRNQWPGLSGAFVTYSASYDQHVDQINGGIGIIAMADDAGRGTIRTTDLSLIYSYQLNINRNFSIKAGLQATYRQKKLDWEKLTFGDQIDPRYGFIYNSQEIRGTDVVHRPDFSAGILGFSRKFYFGFAAHHLTQPSEGFASNTARLPLKYTGHIGAVIPISQGLESTATISPNLLFQQQQNFTQLNMGIYVTKGVIVGGLWYRNQDAFIALVGLHNKNLRIGYAYDVTVSKLSNDTNGSHELSLAFYFECRPKKRKFRIIDCPSF